MSNYSLWNWMTPLAPAWWPSDYRLDVETFSGWRKAFAAERELILKERGG